jgi:DNA polymerase III alpha subunit
MRIRTGFSFKTAYGHIKDVSSRLDEIGWQRQPIADRSSTYGFVRWTKLVKNPIYGVELAVVPTLGEKKPIISYWTFYAMKDLMALHSLIADATSNPGREPSLTYEEALKAEGVIRIADERVQLDHVQNVQGMFIGLSPALPRGLFLQAKAQGLSFMATSDNLYPRAADKELYRIALGARSTTQTYPQHILSDDEWRKACEYNSTPEERGLALINRANAFTKCVAKLGKATLLIPEKNKTLRQLCEEGAEKLDINLDDPVYHERLNKELKMIADKKFEDYFYIIADMVNWAKERMIVGPARGSSCGSLACYLLGITAINPIPFGLIFERFIDVTRADLPDIDIDFSDTRRELVFEYAEKKYGADHVARLGTVSLFKPRSALNQAGKSLRIPSWQIEKVLDGLIERSLGDSRVWQTLEDTMTGTEAGRTMLAEFPEAIMAAQMESHPANASQHAAGIVITQEPIQNYVAVDSRTKSAMCDKYDAESLNLLKIDALGLTQLSIFERTLELIGKPDRNGYLESLPLNDGKAFEVLNNRHFAGVFQFNGLSLQSLSKQIKFTSIEDLIVITALARPGPMATGGANSWVKRKLGTERIDMMHPLLEPYLRNTLGIVVYQEDVLKIGREIGDLSWEEVTLLRKAMSKSLGKEYFDQFGDRWKVGAAKRGIDKFIADKIWDSLCSMGSWAFNRSHAVAYGLVSYYCCYLKAYFPAEFAAATLDAESDVYRQIQLLRELKLEGIDYIPIDVEHSEARWAIKDTGNSKVLVGPLTSIKGIGPASVKEILTARERGQPLRPALEKRLSDARTGLDSLYPITDAVKKVDLDALKIVSSPWPIKEVQCGVRGHVMIMGVITKIAPKDENEAVNVMKREAKGRRGLLTGPTSSLNLFVRDDTDEIFCKIDRFNYEELGRQVAETGRAGKSLYAIKGECPQDFRMIRVENIRYLGEMDNILDDSGMRTAGTKLTAGEQE